MNNIRSRVLKEHAQMLKKVGSDRASSIGKSASNKFGRAGDEALRLAKKHSK